MLLVLSGRLLLRGRLWLCAGLLLRTGLLLTAGLWLPLAALRCLRFVAILFVFGCVSILDLVIILWGRWCWWAWLFRYTRALVTFLLVRRHRLLLLLTFRIVRRLFGNLAHKTMLRITVVLLLLVVVVCVLVVVARLLGFWCVACCT